MEEKHELDEVKRIEAVVGEFDDAATANEAARELSDDEVILHRVSLVDRTANKDMPEIVYDEVQEVDEGDVARGILKGGAIGAGSGLLFLAIPGLNIAAPIAGALAGAWIGGIAAIDEALRGIELPNSNDYRKRLAQGKSFLVIVGDEVKRIQYAAKLQLLGANKVHQHPPVLEAAFHRPPTDATMPANQQNSPSHSG